MSSPYAERLAGYGQHWQRPWLFLGCLLAACLALGTRQSRTYSTPINSSKYEAAVCADGLCWTADLDAAIARAERENRLLLLSFVGVTDTRAKLNERAVFVKPEVKYELRDFVLVALYVDEVPSRFYRVKHDGPQRQLEAQANYSFEISLLMTEATPLYAIAEPDGAGSVKVLNTVAGKIEEAKFTRFLREPREHPIITFIRDLRDRLLAHP